MIEGLGRGRPAFLASVTTAAEAAVALRGGADIIDCKDPSRGALGALDLEIVRDIVSTEAGRACVSATIGDQPSEAKSMLAAATAMAATGVDFVKIGFFGDRDPRPAIQALGEAAIAAQLVAVVMADRQPDFAIIDALARSGFAGVMLDTADKYAGRLTDVLPKSELRRFVRRAHAHNLFAGLAGSLAVHDIASLASAGSDVLGFRGALCIEGRTSALAFDKVCLVRAEMTDATHRQSSQESAPA